MGRSTVTFFRTSVILPTCESCPCPKLKGTLANSGTPRTVSNRMAAELKTRTFGSQENHQNNCPEARETYIARTSYKTKESREAAGPASQKSRWYFVQIYIWSCASEAQFHRNPASFIASTPTLSMFWTLIICWFIWEFPHIWYVLIERDSYLTSVSTLNGRRGIRGSWVPFGTISVY